MNQNSLGTGAAFVLIFDFTDSFDTPFNAISHANSREKTASNPTLIALNNLIFSPFKKVSD